MTTTNSYPTAPRPHRALLLGVRRPRAARRRPAASLVAETTPRVAVDKRQRSWKRYYGIHSDDEMDHESFVEDDGVREEEGEEDGDDEGPSDTQCRTED